MIPTVFIASMETALNTYLSLDPIALKKCRDLSGKKIKVTIENLKITLYIFPQAKGFQLATTYAGEADTEISGTPFGLFKASLTDTEAMQDIHITGDVELGQRFHRLLREIDIDWEEHLATFTGDIIAHQIGSFARATKHWCKKSSQSMQANLSEFLHEEIRLLPPSEELNDFYHNVNELRNDIERLEQRINFIKD